MLSFKKPTTDFAVRSCYCESVLHSKHEDEEAEVCEASGKGTSGCVAVRHLSRLGENIRRERFLIVVILVLIKMTRREEWNQGVRSNEILQLGK